MSDHASALFEVTDHFEVTGRGVLVVGHVVGGRFRKGMLVHTEDDPAVLTIASIGFLCNTKERKYLIDVTFREKPSLAFVKRVFPVGSVLHIEDAQSADK